MLLLPKVNAFWAPKAAAAAALNLRRRGCSPIAPVAVGECVRALPFLVHARTQGSDPTALLDEGLTHNGQPKRRATQEAGI